jgi:hypothetical protein
MSMLLQTTTIHNMLINNDPPSYNQLIPIRNPLPENDDGSGGGVRQTYSIHPSDMYVHFDASKILSSDYDFLTKKITNPPTNLVDGTPFTLNTAYGNLYPPKYDYGGMHCDSGNLSIQLPDTLQNLYPTDIDISCISVNMFS